MTDFNIGRFRALSVHRSPAHALLLGGSILQLLAVTSISMAQQKPVGNPPAAATTNQPMTLRMKFKQGEVSRYKMSMRSSLPLEGDTKNAPVKYDTTIDLTLEQVVQKVNADGSAEVSVSTLSGDGVMNGAPFKATKSSSIIKLDALNNILSSKNMNGGATSALSNTMFQTGELSTQGVYLPHKPVRVGDSWIQTVRIQGLTSDNKSDKKTNTSGSVKSTFVRVENIGLLNTVRLHSELRVPFVAVDPKDKVSMNGMLSMTYDSNVSLSTGQVVRSAGIGEIGIDLPGKYAGDTSTAGKSNGSKSAGVRTPIKRVTVKLQIGNNLITQ